MNAPKYEVLVLAPGWQDCEPEKLPVPGISHDAALYIVCETGDMFEAFAVAKQLDFNPKSSQVFRIHARSRPVRQGPQKTVYSTHQVVMCFLRGEVQFFRPLGHQSISGNLTSLLDDVADHTCLSERAVLTYDSKAKSSAEFDTIVVEGKDLDTRVIDRRRFDVSTARTSRRLKAYLSAADEKTLKADRRTLQNYYAWKPFDETRKIVTIAPPRDSEEKEGAAVLGMVKSAIKRAASRDAGPGNENGPTKRRKRVVSSRSGIAKKTLVSNELFEFLTTHCKMDGLDPQEGVARTDVVRCLPKYIKEKQLNQGRVVIPDEPLRTLFPPDFDFEKCEVTFFTIYKYINHNFQTSGNPGLEKETTTG